MQISIVYMNGIVVTLSVYQSHLDTVHLAAWTELEIQETVLPLS